MTFEVTFDLVSIFLIIAIPTLIVFCCGLAMAVTRRISTFAVGSYVENTVNKNNELIKENRELRKQLKGDVE